MSLELPDSAVELINSGVHTHLTTLNEDGWPQTSLVGVVAEEGELRMASLTIRHKLRNLQRDPRRSISWESLERDKIRLPYYLVVRGHAEVTEGGARQSSCGGSHRGSSALTSSFRAATIPPRGTSSTSARRRCSGTGRGSTTPEPALMPGPRRRVGRPRRALSAKLG